MNSLAATHMVRDDEGAKRFLETRGIVIPPVFEVIRTLTEISFRHCFIGWRVADKATDETKGAIAIYSSTDGEDWEIIADGGWNLPGAKMLFRYIFDDSGQWRVTARCKASNEKNIRILAMFGFKPEGRKRLQDGDVILFGMLRSECKLLEAK